MTHVRVIDERHCRAPEGDCLKAERLDQMLEKALVLQLLAETVLKNDKQALQLLQSPCFDTNALT